MGNSNPSSIVGIGYVSIKMHDGVIRILKEVRHVLDLTRNLISLGTLDDSRYNFKVKKGMLKVKKGVLVVMKGRKMVVFIFLIRENC